MKRARVVVAVVAGVLAVGAVVVFSWGKGRSGRLVSDYRDPPPWTFPQGFLWDTATADHQIEWSQPDDWTDFERAVLEERRFESLGPGKARPGHIGGLGDWPVEAVEKKTDFDSRLEADLDLAVGMHQNAFRFSFSWARLFPTAETTSPDPAGLAFYRRLLDALEARNLTPVATLFHFALPAWLAAEKDGLRGWERADAPAHFERFARAAAESFGGDVRIWCTLNEPVVYAYLGYLEGVMPPLERRGSPDRISQVLAQQLRGHVLAFRALKDDAARRGIATSVGMTHHVRAIEAWRPWAPLDRIGARLAEDALVWDFAEAVESGVLAISLGGPPVPIEGLAGTQDYVGINYYGRHYLKTDLFRPMAFQVLEHDPEGGGGEQVNDLGWASYPKGFYDTLAEAARRWRKPLYVLENGTADAADDDRTRQRFLVEHVREMHHALRRAGADLKGYFHWSLTDNFEWAQGFDGRFGLVKVDYRDGFRRTPRPSAALYGRIARANGIDAEQLAREWKLAP